MPPELAEAPATNPQTRGPKTDEGKAHSRVNSLKHGLTGAGVILPADMAAEVARREADWATRYDTTANTEAASLVRQIALASVRIEQCQAEELAASPHLLQRDLDFWDDDRRDSAECVYQRLAANPPRILGQLKRRAHGCERLRRAWLTLDVTLATTQAWTAEQLSTALDLIGLPAANRSYDPDGAWFTGQAAITADPATSPERRAKAVEELRGRIARELGALRDQEHKIRDCADEPERALLKGGVRLHEPPALRRLRRYEAAATHTYVRCFERLEALGLKIRATDSPQPEAQDRRVGGLARAVRAANPALGLPDVNLNPKADVARALHEQMASIPQADLDNMFVQAVVDRLGLKPTLDPAGQMRLAEAASVMSRR